jgi:hypothetical protein
MRDDLVGHFAFPLVKAVIIHNPVDLERIRCLAAEVSSGDHEPPACRSKTAPHLVAAGRLSRQKGCVAIKRFFAGETGSRRITLTPFHVDKIVDQHQNLLTDQALPKLADHER